MIIMNKKKIFFLTLISLLSTAGTITYAKGFIDPKNIFYSPVSVEPFVQEYLESVEVVSGSAIKLKLNETVQDEIAQDETIVENDNTNSILPSIEESTVNSDTSVKEDTEGKTPDESDILVESDHEIIDSINTLNIEEVQSE